MRLDDPTTALETLRDISAERSALLERHAGELAAVNTRLAVAVEAAKQAGLRPGTIYDALGMTQPTVWQLVRRYGSDKS